MTVPTAREDIRDGIREAVGIIGEGESWLYQLLTSKPGISPETFGASVAFNARKDNMTKARGYNQETRSSEYRARQIITVYDGTTLNVGDRIIDPQGVVWSFESIQQSGIGIEHWEIGRDVATLQGEPNRGGL